MSRKYLILVPDGMADEPLDELDGRTPLEVAETPNMDAWAARSEVGLARTVQEGFYPGSDVANLAIFGYDAAEYYTGRAPLEAANMGIELGDCVAFRCNLVTLADGKMADFTAGHISSEEAAELVATLQEELGGGELVFHAGVSYRHLAIAPPGWNEVECTAPHDITGRDYAPHLPRGRRGADVTAVMEASRAVLRDHPVNVARRAAGRPEVTSIWFWGQGTRPAFPTLEEKYGVSGAVVSAVDLVFGIGKLLGMEAVRVPGATGFIDTNFEGKARAALATLERVDLVYVHVEAPDEAGHMGDVALKTQAIADFDRRCCGVLLEGLDRFPDHRILLMPDHPTPCAIKTHTADPVPYLLYDAGQARPGPAAFTERTARERATEPVVGHTLMHRLLQD